jgi:undecaprenyl-diphosphatase
MDGRCISDEGSMSARAGMNPARRLLLALALFACVIAIGLIQPTGLIAPADRLAMKIVEHLRWFPGAGLVTAASEWLDRIGQGGARIWIALIIGLFLARAGRPRAMLWLIVTVSAMVLINPLVKLAFLAPRPDVVEHLVAISSNSFPSGHAAGAMTLYGAIALLFPHRAVRLFCAIMILATGLSRVWLGVHWPSDVIGGWIEGLAWLIALSPLLARRETIA